uniref:Uncharacterized protein n=1 Tax=Schizaphis graminum TaxID=13262 RepID=A0A2S2NFA4_SCHGA
MAFLSKTNVDRIKPKINREGTDWNNKSSVLTRNKNQTLNVGTLENRKRRTHVCAVSRLKHEVVEARTYKQPRNETKNVPFVGAVGLERADWAVSFNIGRWKKLH